MAYYKFLPLLLEYIILSLLKAVYLKATVPGVLSRVILL